MGIAGTSAKCWTLTEKLVRSRRVLWPPRRVRLRYHEDVLEGIEQVPRALLRLYAGLNIGKQIVRADPDAR